MKIIYALAAFVVIGRFTIEPRLTNIPSWNLTYEALAHLIVGGLIGACWVQLRMFGIFGGHQSLIQARKRAFVLGFIAIGLTLFEVAMFIAQKNGVDVFDPIRTVLLLLMYLVYPYLPPSWKG